VTQPRLSRAIFWTTIVFLFLPLVVLMVFSFNEGRTMVWKGFSLKWYESLFLNQPRLWTAVGNTLIVAFTSSILATVIGTLGAIAISWYRFRAKAYIQTMSFLPLILPEIIIGVSLLVFFRMIGLPLSIWTIIIAHTSFTMPFVLMMVMARLGEFDYSIIEAARDLGARESQALVEHRPIKLHRARPGADFFIGVFGGRNPADTDQRQLAVQELRQTREHPRGLFEQGRAGKPASLPGIGTFQTFARQRGVRRHDAIDPGAQRHLGHVFQFGHVQIGGDLQENRQRTGQCRTRVEHAAQKRRKRLLALQIAQLLGVGRGDIHRDELDMRTGALQHEGEIGRAVGAVLVRAKVEPDRDALRPSGQPRCDRLHPFVVEAKAVDHCLIFGQAPEPRPRVALLRARRGGPHFEKAEAKLHQRRERHRVLVEARRKAHRVWQLEPGDLRGKPGALHRAATGHEPHLQRLQRQTMRGFRIEAMQQAQPQRFGDAHTSASGKMWPETPSGRAVSQTTSARRNGR